MTFRSSTLSWPRSGVTIVLPIWDLCHYGYPDGLDPFDPDSFVLRFAAYARAAARYVAERAHHGPLCIGPINEPTFWGYMGGEWAWCAPFGRSREDRLRFTTVLARADIAACKAIRQDFPDARFVHIDPLIWVVPPRDRPDLADEAHREAYEDAYLAWDVISGLKHPEYGGSLELIDILGLNNYSFGQMEYAGGGKPNEPLKPGDNRIRPVADLIWEIMGQVSAAVHHRRDLRPLRWPSGLAQRYRVRKPRSREPRGRVARDLPVPRGGHDRLAHRQMAAHGHRRR